MKKFVLYGLVISIVAWGISSIATLDFLHSSWWDVVMIVTHILLAILSFLMIHRYDPSESIWRKGWLGIVCLFLAPITGLIALGISSAVSWKQGK